MSSSLTPEERRKIYLEEKARAEAKDRLAAEEKERVAKRDNKDTIRGGVGCLGLIILLVAGAKYCPSEHDVKHTSTPDGDHGVSPSISRTDQTDHAQAAGDGDQGHPSKGIKTAEGVNCEYWSDLLFFLFADIDDVNRCMQAGADPNARSKTGMTPLYSAAFNNKTESVTRLLEAGADPNARASSMGEYPMHAGVRSANIEIVTALLKAGGDVNVKTSPAGQTPLMWAVGVSKPHAAEVVKLLLRMGANPNARDEIDRSPLHHTAYAEAVKELIGAGALLEARDRTGGTPLHQAALWNHTEAVKALIDWGADVNAQDNEGETPLHWAAAAAENDKVAEEVASALLAAGADPYARDNRGNYPVISPGLIRRFRESGVYHPRRPAESQAQSTNRTREYGVVPDPKVARGAEPGQWDGVYRVGSGVTSPTVLSRIKPVYSEAARKATLEGKVVLSAIVRKDGSLEVLKVVRGLGLGLDENAIKALKKWRFRPGKRNGKPVDVALNIEVAFSLRSRF